MSEFRGHPKELEQLFPGASISALANLPAGFAQDQGKARAFIATWARAEAYAGLLEQHLNNLNRSYRTPDPEIVGPSFQELGQQYSASFMSKIRIAASKDGKVPASYFNGEFTKAMDAVFLLETNVKKRHHDFDVESIGRGFSGRRGGRS